MEIERREAELVKELEKEKRKTREIITCGVIGFLGFGTLNEVSIWQEAETFVNISLAVLKSAGEGLAILAIIAIIGAVAWLPLNLWAEQSKENTTAYYAKVGIIALAVVVIIGVSMGNFTPLMGR